MHPGGHPDPAVPAPRDPELGRISRDGLAVPRLDRRSEKVPSERLRRAQCERDAALESSQAKDRFLAELSHELRSPLQVMASWMALLRAGTLDSAMQKHALEVIERNLKAQAAMVDELLDLARIGSGKLTIEAVPVDLSTIVSDALDEHWLVAASRGVALEGPEGRDPLIVRGDARLLAQVVANLLGNALKFTPEGGAVRIALVPEAAVVAIEVCDTGDGIAPDLLPHVFDRARQGRARDGRVRSGLGLGLTIAKHLVEQHGGSITAASEGNGRGALFRVTLPRAGEA